MRRCISALICAAVILSSLSFSAFAASDEYPRAGLVATQSTGLNVRSSIGGSIVTSLPKGSYVRLLGEENGWYKLEYASGKQGYSSAAYIEKIAESYSATVKTSSGGLNVRQSAGGTIITSLASGTVVTVITEASGWSKIIYSGTSTGWVSSQYLVTAQSSGYAAISLDVVSFKQTDSRWADTKIGSTNYTIEQIGCTTTALAMTESFRTGKTVYPNEMASRLTYSSTGSLYWPSNYSTTQQFDNYMELIYSLLAQGKPVIVGAKKADGSQHWVVVKGVYSVTTLSPSAFKINDPGSSTRTSLGQFFSQFPYLHRIVWYN